MNDDGLRRALHHVALSGVGRDDVTDLVRDPAHATTRDRLRSALDTWLAQTEGRGAIPEAEMAERFWPGGVEPVTPPPSIDLRRAGAGRVRVTVTCSEPGASLGYRVGGGRWQLYTSPLDLPRGGVLTAKAVRYGWGESDEVRVDLRASTTE